MSFWKNFSRNINTAGKSAIQKTRDMAGIASLNSEIAQSQRKIEDLQREIGRIVMDTDLSGMTSQQIEELIASDDSGEKKLPAPDWKEILKRAAAIRAEEANIAGNEKKITVLRGVVTCPHCGQEVSVGMTFCPHCGTRLSEEQDPQKQGDHDND